MTQAKEQVSSWWNASSVDGHFNPKTKTGSIDWNQALAIWIFDRKIHILIQIHILMQIQLFLRPF